MTGSFGRLDGYVWSVDCGHDTHLHVQITLDPTKTPVQIFDIAIPDAADVWYYDQDLTASQFPVAWSAGWHAGSSYALDYVTNLHLCDGSPPACTITWNADAGLRAHVADELKHANHISIYTTPYSSGDGGHYIHRQNSPMGNDGAIILNPLSSTPHGVFFRFTTQSF